MPFGITDFAHIKKKWKLEPREIKCIFLGYPEGVKGHKLRCIDAEKEITFVCRDVLLKVEEFPMKLDSEVSKHCLNNF